MSKTSSTTSVISPADQETASAAVAPKKPFNPYLQFQYDEDHEKDGIWIMEPFFRVKVARAGGKNTAYTSFMEATVKPYRRLIATDALPDKTMTDITVKVYLKTIIKGWSIPAGFDDNGAPLLGADGQIVWKDGYMHDPDTFEEIEASAENIARLLAKPKIGSEVLDGIAKVANNPLFFREEESADIDAKN